MAVGAQGGDAWTPGVVDVFLGGPGGPTAAPIALTIAGIDSQGLGRGVTSAGDTNGDGYGDLVVSASIAMNEVGDAYVFFGSASGVDPTPIDLYNDFSWGVSGGGDVNGDGYTDIAVSQSNTGALIYLGSASGPPTLATSGIALYPLAGVAL